MDFVLFCCLGKECENRQKKQHSGNGWVVPDLADPRKSDPEPVAGTAEGHPGLQSGASEAKKAAEPGNARTGVKVG